MAQGIIISQYVYYAMIAALVIIPIFCILIMVSIFKAIPWAWPMYRAFQKNMPVIWKHHARGASEIMPIRVEKELHEGVPVTYYIVDKWGLKLTDIAGERTELLNGKLRVIHYFKNSVSPQNVTDCVAIDQLCTWLTSKGVNVTNREDAIMFVLSNFDKLEQMESIISASRVHDESTKKLLMNALDVIKKHEKDIKSQLLKDGVFVFQTALTAVDRLDAFTSAAFSNAKSAIEAQMKSKMAQNPNGELYKMIIILAALLICAAVAYAIISKSGVL